MLKLIRKLTKIGLLTPAGLFYFAAALASEGINLMTLLRYAARRNGRKLALTDEQENLSYEDLYRRSRRLASVLQTDFHLQPGQKAAFLCRSHAQLISAVFGVSRLGVNVYLLNPEMTAGQFASLHARHSFDFLVYDPDVCETIDEAAWQNNSLVTCHQTLPSIESLSKKDGSLTPVKIKRAFSGEIIVLTGGTTGTPKTARRKPSVFNFLNPFFELLTKLNLDAYQSVYIATPAYHGFGIAAIFIGLILGERMFLLPRFNAEKACGLISKNKIEAVTLVPLMLQRMLDHDPAALASLECIISGGAPLNPALAGEALDLMGDKLFNLYGTSEAGFSVIATPADLRRRPDTIGRKIAGVKLSILNGENKPVKDGTIGRICIKSSWTTQTAATWVETGDLGYQDEAGYLYLCGRSDEMIVSGGENVYPVELENVLHKHPEIRQAAVVGVPDEDFGQRLKAFIVPAPESHLTRSEVFDWLKSRVARFQMPVAIEFLEELPVTSIGKINKKSLS